MLRYPPVRDIGKASAIYIWMHWMDFLDGRLLGNLDHSRSADCDGNSLTAVESYRNQCKSFESQIYKGHLPSQAPRRICQKDIKTNGRQSRVIESTENQWNAIMHMRNYVESQIPEINRHHVECHRSQCISLGSHRNHDQAM